MHFAEPPATVGQTSESGSSSTLNAKCKLSGGGDIHDDEEVTEEIPPVVGEPSSSPNEWESPSKMQPADDPTIEGLNPSAHLSAPLISDTGSKHFETMLPQPSSPVIELDLDALDLVVPAIPDAEIEQIIPNISTSPIASSPSTPVNGMAAESSSHLLESDSLGSISSASPPRSTIANVNAAILTDPPSTPLRENAVSVPEDQPPDPIPAIFCLLFHSLELHYRKGQSRPLRSVVGAELAKHENLYQRAGVGSFKEYIALAEKGGIVTCGGNGGYAWVSLKLLGKMSG